ncbi:hypothetical protein EYF80_066301 [Liparis tanakae]|uniref:Uncharacterized protein n=1 Tax=Liparis tanakae TaxID=230148 RepID=A0A4Z2E4C0_9TELE|nr:hypothetical protein EYF80_066301 [Liparis tanakae]
MKREVSWRSAGGQLEVSVESAGGQLEVSEGLWRTLEDSGGLCRSLGVSEADGESLPDSGSLGFTSSGASSCTGSSSGPCEAFRDSLLVLPRPTSFMKDRRRLLESASPSGGDASPREPSESRYRPANLDHRDPQLLLLDSRRSWWTPRGPVGPPEVLLDPQSIPLVSVPLGDLLPLQLNL